MIKHIALLCVIALLAACGQQPETLLTHLSGNTMGTTYNIKFAANDDIKLAELSNKIERRLFEINKHMSTYDPESELSQFNKSRFTKPITLSDETALVVKEAMRLGKLSNGVLDVTVGPLVNLWGFGPTKRPEKIPSDEQVAEVRQYVGLDKITLNGNRLTKRHPLVYVDLSTIAKGYAVDELAAIIEPLASEGYLVEIGGEMRVKGTKPNGEDWRIAIEKPVTTERAAQRVITIGDNAIATSGDYRNYFEQDGMRYSHLINPKTGNPIQHNTVSATVVHPSSMVADGLATALNVMEWSDAIALAEDNELAVFIIRKTDDGFEEYESPMFDEWVD